MPEDSQALEVYADTFQVTVSPFGVNMTFGMREAHQAARVGPTKELVTVRMSPEHAKVVAMMLRRQLKMYESQNAVVIQIPAQIYTQLGLPSEDWGN